MKRVKIQSRKSKNPLFEEWLLAWKVAAAEQGSEMQYTFGKALRSLQKYPFSLKSGKECIILESFGKKICDMLDKKLDEYRKSLTTAEWAELMSKDPLTDTVAVSVELNCKNVSNSGQKTPRKQPGKSLGDLSSEFGFVPHYRSGSYALLLALYKVEGSEEFLTKSQLINEAQSLCDTSFTRAESGSLYTAWSSMATLLKKRLVSKSGKPVKFQLTKEGVVLAKHLSTLSENDFKIFAADTPPRKQKQSSSKDITPPKRAFLTYPDQDPPSDSQTRLLPFSKGFTSSSCSIFSKDLCTENLSSQFTSAPIDSHTDTLKYSKVAQTTVFSKDINNMNIALQRSAIEMPSSLNSCSQPFSSGPTLNFQQPSTSSYKYSQSKSSTVTSSQTSSESSVRESSCDNERETVFLFPGKFQIILLVDIRETEMKGKECMDVMLQNLSCRGITCETRHLTVGDFAWIARDSSNCELTLPYIVERKRLDDMASSIKDGRFHEQKFRLKRSGIKNIIYLVEKYGKDSQKLGLPLLTLQQASINTQIVDQFTVKVSRSHDDSIRYLSCLTKLLTKLFKDKTLMSCPVKNLPEFDIKSDLQCVMTFQQFNKDSSKIRNYSVKDMLVKQLIQLKGLSVDKATAIADRYPTPCDLIAALREGGEKVLADLPCGPLRRIGPAIAQPIHQLYTQHVLQ